jgi:hypothetical protein
VRPTIEQVLALNLAYDAGTGEILAPAVGRIGTREIGFLSGNIDEGDALGLLFAAAPDMARALLELAPRKSGTPLLPCWCRYPRVEGDAHDDTCEKARTALTKAGVL